MITFFRHVLVLPDNIFPSCFSTTFAFNIISCKGEHVLMVIEGAFYVIFTIYCYSRVQIFMLTHKVRISKSYVDWICNIYLFACFWQYSNVFYSCGMYNNRGRCVLWPGMHHALAVFRGIHTFCPGVTCILCFSHRCCFCYDATSSIAWLKSNSALVVPLMATIF